MVAENAIVLGLGVSGEAAARLLVRQGATVTVVDRAAAGALIAGEIESLLALGVRVLMGVTSLPVDAFDLCVVSPGIDQSSAWVREMERRNIEVISELELGFRHCVCPIIAVTGTNGKSTLVKLLSDVLRLGGIRTEIAGNYGTPLSSVVEQGAAWDWIVVEVSSFQLERVSMFHPRVGVLLNIQPDHLNRHGDMQTYRTLKSRLFNCMGEHDVAVVHDVELSGVKSLVTGAPQWVSFGLSAEANVTYDATEGVVCRDDTGKRVAIRVAGTAFDNPVLGLAVAAAVATVRSCGINPDLISEYLQKFTPLSHRIEAVRIVDDISFVDDSKATNLAALRAGIEIIKGPVRLIAGGQLKEKDLEFVKEVLARNVACVYVIGEASELLIRAWQDTVPCLACGELAVAVRLAFKNAVPGDTVLLSPGCASFDQFRSYRDRGEQFKRIVEEIKEERKHENIVAG